MIKATDTLWLYDYVDGKGRKRRTPIRFTEAEARKAYGHCKRVPGSMELQSSLAARAIAANRK